MLAVIIRAFYDYQIVSENCYDILPFGLLLLTNNRSLRLIKSHFGSDFAISLILCTRIMFLLFYDILYAQQMNIS